MKKLKEIIRNSGMSTSPEFYSGRGANLIDLNGGILEKIYLSIENENGKEAASNYVNMIAGIKVMSATTFLQELYRLNNNNWKYLKTENNASGISIMKNDEGKYDQNHANISLYEALNSRFDHTQQIKSHFLNTHNIKPQPIYNSYNDITYYRY